MSSDRLVEYFTDRRPGVQTRSPRPGRLGPLAAVCFSDAYVRTTVDHLRSPLEGIPGSPRGSLRAITACVRHGRERVVLVTVTKGYACREKEEEKLKIRWQLWRTGSLICHLHPLLKQDVWFLLTPPPPDHHLLHQGTDLKGTQHDWTALGWHSPIHRANK